LNTSKGLYGLRVERNLFPDVVSEYQLTDRLSFMRFVGLALGDRVRHAKTIWLFREQLTRGGAPVPAVRRRCCAHLAQAHSPDSPAISPPEAPMKSLSERVYKVRSASTESFEHACALAMGGQIVDATVVQARRLRLTADEKVKVKGGGVPAGCSTAKQAQMDTDGHRTLKRSRKGGRSIRASRICGAQTEIAGPVFGYKNHLGIDRWRGFIRSFQ
jgi:IS5 family transposase